MELLNIITTFSLSERQAFTSFLKKRNKRRSIKNLDFLKMVESGEHKELDVALYGHSAKGPFHGLHMRVKDAAVDFFGHPGF